MTTIVQTSLNTSQAKCMQDPAVAALCIAQIGLSVLFRQFCVAQIALKAAQAQHWSTQQDA